jgi:hypothetical protein
VRRPTRAVLPALLAALAAAAPAPARTLFQDDFNGPSGAPPNPSSWTAFPNDISGYLRTSPVRAENARQTGTGRLAMRVQREPDGYRGPFATPAAYSSSFIGTFGYGTGWPPTGVKRSFPVPFRVEMRARYPDAPGLWGGLWPMSVDRDNRGQGVYELDVAEQRTTLPTEAGCHWHLFRDGAVTSWDGARRNVTLSDWHVYGAIVRRGGVDYYVDGRRCGTGPAPGVTGRFGILLDMKVAPPGSWGAAGGAVPDDDPGPWDLLIDYVRATTA